MKHWILEIKVSDDGINDYENIEYFEEEYIKKLIKNSPKHSGIEIEILKIKEE